MKGLDSLLGQMLTNRGSSVQELAAQQPVMLIFLRHFGCTFCREALADISQRREDLEAQGGHIVFVHMADDATAERYFQRYGLGDCIHVGDPECRFYKAFGLMKGNFNQLFGLATWLRGFEAGVLEGHGIGLQLGDGFQMPGVFVLHEGKIRDKFIHKLASDRPDYDKLLRCCSLEAS